MTIVIACRSEGIDIACRRKNLFKVKRPLLLGKRLDDAGVRPEQSVKHQCSARAQRLRLFQGALEQQRGRRRRRERQRPRSCGLGAPCNRRGQRACTCHRARTATWPACTPCRVALVANVVCQFVRSRPQCLRPSLMLIRRLMWELRLSITIVVMQTCADASF